MLVGAIPILVSAILILVGATPGRLSVLAEALTDRQDTKGGPVFRHATAFAIVILLAPASLVGAADLRITDSRGTEVLLVGASVDYSSFMTSDKDADGIRVLQGDGTVTVKWAEVESLKVVRRDESVKPPRIEIEIALRSGKKVPAALLRQGQMKLLGTTELGDYSIDLDKVRTIAPVR
jgi:hypothetical protein